MADQLTAVRIIGVALVLFTAVLLGVGIHHLVATGTCSSTGYSANYGPVPHCPAGTGWWMAFVFAGIIGGIVGGLMAGSIGLLFAGIFGGIGFGALSLLFDSNAQSGTQIFAAAFGGAFALVGVIAGVTVLGGALKSLFGGMRGGGSKQVRYGKTKISSRGSGSTPATTTFSTPTGASVSINATGSGSASMGVPSHTPAATPLNLIPGLQAARTAATGDAVDELSKLAALHERGGLTDEEFASAKAKLLQQL